MTQIALEKSRYVDNANPIELEIRKKIETNPAPEA